MSLRPSRSLRLLGALLVAGAVCAVPAAARLDGPDTHPPVITITFPTDGQEITSDQGALPTQFTCDEPVIAGEITSGKASCTGDATIDTTKNGDQSLIVDTSDNAGNRDEKRVNYRIVDRIAPQITITAPVEGKHYPLHFEDSSAIFNCTDQGGARLDTCTAADPFGQSFDTGPAGPHVWTALAIDSDGNRTTKTVHYVIDPTEANVVHNPAGADAIADKALSASNAALKTLRKKGKATLAFNAYAGMKISVNVTARVKGRTVAIAKASGTAGGEGIKLTLKASGSAAAALKHKGKLALHVSVTIDDPNGNAKVTKGKTVSTRR